MTEEAAPAPPADVRARLHGWRHPAVLAVVFLSVASGYAQYSVTAALGDVAAAFGEATEAVNDIAAQVGLSGTTLGLGLAAIRIASLGAMPLAALADHRGRRPVILACCSVGLAITAIGGASPTYWWFVVLFALARPLLSATNAIAGVIAAEETTSADRATAMAAVAAGYGIGAGVAAIVRGIGGDLIGFRALFVSALVPLVLVLLVSRWLEEPSRYARAEEEVSGEVAPRPRFGSVEPELRGRLALFFALAFSVAFATGPMNSYLFVYAEGVVGLGSATMALLVTASGPLGLGGLVLGRWGADASGRRITAAGAQIGVAGAGALTYNLGAGGVMAGYLVAVMAGAAFAPPATALASEIFPTHVRSTAAGWLAAAGVLGAVAGLIAFGALADAVGGFGRAAVIVVVPVALATVGYAWLPETRGLELEESAPVPSG